MNQPDDKPPDRIAIVTDELSDDLPQAVQLATKLAIRNVEVRGFAGGRVPHFPQDQLIEAARIIRDSGLSVVGISPALGKDKPPVADAIFPAIECARLFDAPSITVFGIPRSIVDPDEIAHATQTLRGWAEAGRQAGIRLAVENSASCHADRSTATFALAAATQMRVIWDPANAAGAGEVVAPSLTSDQIAQIERVHVKGYQPGEGIVLADQGVIDWRLHIRCLLRDGFDGLFTIEPHQWHDRLHAATHSLHCLRRWLAEV